MAVRTRFGVPNALGLRPSVVRMACGGSPDAPQGALGASWDRPSRPESALGASRTRPRPLLGASPSVCRVTPNASERSKAKFSCFFVVSAPIFLDSDELFDRLFGGLGILDTTLDSLSILSLDVPRCMDGDTVRPIYRRYFLVASKQVRLVFLYFFDFFGNAYLFLMILNKYR